MAIGNISQVLDLCILLVYNPEQLNVITKLESYKHITEEVWKYYDFLFAELREASAACVLIQQSVITTVKLPPAGNNRYKLAHTERIGGADFCLFLVIFKPKFPFLSHTHKHNLCRWCATVCFIAWATREKKVTIIIQLECYQFAMTAFELHLKVAPEHLHTRAF